MTEHVNHPNGNARSAVVTGATGGIGRCIASYLADLGYDVGLTDLDSAAVDSVRNTLSSAVTTKVVGVAADLSQPNSVQLVVDSMAGELGGIDVLVNCAGILNDARVPKMEPELFRQVVSINLAGMLQTTAVAIPYLRASGSGRIVSLTSRAWLGNFGSSNYSASEGGIAGASRSLALSLASSNITVNCIAPGFIETPMSNSMPSEIIDRVRQSSPIGRVGTPQDVARTVAFLADKGGGYITGQTITVCGGRSISGSIRTAQRPTPGR